MQSNKKLVDTIADLRWLLFIQYPCEVSKLSPTTSTLKYTIFQAHYVALILKSVHRLLKTYQTHADSAKN